MNLLDKLRDDTIVTIKSSNQKEAILELLLYLQKLEILRSTNKIFSKITIKENLLSSAVGRGIAYPHSTSIEINELACILGISKTGIDFNSPDEQLCHIILLTLSPEKNPHVHRKFITRFRTMIEKPEFRSYILEAKHNKDILSIIQNWEDDESYIDELY